MTPTRLLIWPALMLALMLAFSAGAATGQQVVTPATLQARIDAAPPGAVLRLAGGRYGALRLAGAQGTAGAALTLVADNPVDPPRFAAMTLAGTEHLVLDGMTFDYTFATGDPIWLRPFKISDSRNITIRNAVFDGDKARGVSPEDDGYGYAFALRVERSTDVTLTDNEVRGFFTGFSLTRSDRLTVTGNDIHSLRMDGLKLSQVSRVLIAGNHIHDFRRPKDSPHHPDMIQFFTQGTDAPSRDVTIRDNILNSGKGWYTQSIFMRNERVDKGEAGAAMFYRDITITGNVIINAHLHGITVGETNGLTIRNNTLIRNRVSEGKKDSDALWTPRITVKERSRNVLITGNAVSKVVGDQGRTDWTVTGNVPIQDINRTEPGFYDTVFVAARTGDPRDLASFAYRPDGPLGRGRAGAPQLRTAR